MSRTITIEGYSLRRDANGNYWIQPPHSLVWQDPAASLATAKRWIHRHIAERRTYTTRCLDCGLVGERTGHQTCQYPQNHA